MSASVLLPTGSAGQRSPCTGAQPHRPGAPRPRRRCAAEPRWQQHREPAGEGVLLMLRLPGCPPPPSAGPRLSRGCTSWAPRTQAPEVDTEARKRAPCLLSPWPGPSCPLSPGRMSAEIPQQGASPASIDRGPWQRLLMALPAWTPPAWAPTPRTPAVPHAALPRYLLVLSPRVWDNQLPRPR